MCSNVRNYFQGLVGGDEVLERDGHQGVPRVQRVPGQGGHRRRRRRLCQKLGTEVEARNLDQILSRFLTWLLKALDQSCCDKQLTCEPLTIDSFGENSCPDLFYEAFNDEH